MVMGSYTLACVCMDFAHPRTQKKKGPMEASNRSKTLNPTPHSSLPAQTIFGLCVPLHPTPTTSRYSNKYGIGGNNQLLYSLKDFEGTNSV
mmetsp:Transcript_428/g.531  ORF Transcript_428/g.531 Transcript_428/m.531 type:complete len:91 (+) Transcript_428:1037-1309(+)